MLELYFGSNSIPKESTFIFDVEGLSPLIKLNKTDTIMSKILLDIEQATIIDSDVFADRYGRGLHTKTLSTTSKALLLGYLTDFIINSAEMGANGLIWIAQLPKGKFFFTDYMYNLPNLKSPIQINGVIYTDIVQAYKAMEEF